ncbi:cytoplasmic dynein 2 heavy chain 1 isoform X2 [Daktulosphaira vitifoliae]|uniref:cytoplasmic dynein 2 heavy chain 1 isoform X2 n=1 Tax=Daktulosphaira vitifoliae TaxID=58002 RepID=UPI0021A9D728|nr:cytoplasmic dynein 2 heavy chain 1 isoform X2 [Daktulosphaira vitifoliae]
MSQELITDFRKNLILKTAEIYFGSQTQFDETQINLKSGDEYLNAFLNSPSCCVLFIKNSESNVLEAYDQIISQNEDNNCKIMVFYKSRQESITEENIRSIICVYTIQDSPTKTLYNNLHYIYSPLLLKDENNDLNLDPKLRNLVSDLKMGLKTTIHKNLFKQSKNKIESQLGIILDVQDEIDYWVVVQNNTNNKKESVAAEKIVIYLTSVVKQMKEILIQDLDDYLETIHNCLDDIWKIEDIMYPQTRMEHLFDIFGNDITKIIERFANETDIWIGDYNKSIELLKICKNACDKWIKTCKQLTELYWPNYHLNKWVGKTYLPTNIISFSNYINETISIIRLNNQILQLLTPSEQEKLRSCDNLKSFNKFKHLTPLNSHTTQTWRAVVENFEKKLKPTEEVIVGKLRNLINRKKSNTFELIREFIRYQDIIGRPNVNNQLKGELENFLNCLQNIVNKLGDVDGDNSQKMNTLHLVELQPIIRNLYTLKQQKAQLNEIEKVSSRTLNNLNDYGQLKVSIENHKSSISDTAMGIFNDWIRDKKHSIQNNSFKHNINDPVVYFQTDKLMKVNFNPSIDLLIREIRMLKIFGYIIPSEIELVAETGNKFIKQAKSLEQIASFHNTIGDRMIPSQRPMMLSSAVELMNLVKREQTVTWTDVNSIDNYILEMKRQMEKISLENQTLANYHQVVSNKIINLMEIDILQEQHRWKQVLKSIRDIVKQVEEKFSNCSTWKTHLDYQIYKALNHRYQIGLNSLNQHLPDFRLEIIFRQRQLKFDPPMEEIRMKYFAQLKKFTLIPIHFHGLVDSSTSIFASIIDRNASKFLLLYTRAGELFERLENVLKEWENKVALGLVDIEMLIQENIKTAHDWELNFRSSKSWGQEIAKLNCAELRVECFIISTAAIRLELEIHNRRYWDSLTIMLHSSILFDIVALEKFIEESTSTLRQQVSSTKQLSAIHCNIIDAAIQMDGLFIETVKKQKILSNWTNERIEKISKVQSDWENLKNTLDNHQVIMKKQIEAMKINLLEEGQKLLNMYDMFKSKWQMNKPKKFLEDKNFNFNKVIEFLKKNRAEWNMLNEHKKKLINDNKEALVEMPDFNQYNSIEIELSYLENMWGYFDLFINDLKEIGQENWVNCRNKAYNKIMDLVLKWQEKLQKIETSPLTINIHNEIETLKDFSIYIKYLQGEAFLEKHWRELFSVIGMSHININNLKLEDFINSKETIKNKITHIQELNSRASGEITIRHAFSELEVWEFETFFTKIDHIDSKGNKIHIIGDFKTLFTSIGDKQCLLQSIKNISNDEQFLEKSLIWEKKLLELETCLTRLSNIQRKWLYMDPIFGNKSLKLNQDTKSRFDRIDRDFKYVLEQSITTKVLNFLKINNIEHILESILSLLATTKKCLNNFLEDKRNSFPRFYFLSDEDLLEMIGQTKKNSVVQAHLKKLFSGVQNVQFNSSGNIISIESPQNEIVLLEKPVQVTDHVEEWLHSLMIEITSSLKKNFINCLKETDPLKYPSQILCIVNEVLFSSRCEEAIKKRQLEQLQKSLKNQLNTYTGLNLESATNQNRVLNLKIKALILDTIFHLRVIDELIESRVSALDDWEWQKRLRFYASTDGEINIRMVNAEFSYSYEYQGIIPKLVHTPLTDNCFLTLTQAMSMGLGGNPYGPAGTGKTESVKSLGNLFGRQVLVFNCDEGIDIKSMTRILLGLARCGAWGCFDEFNRLEDTTLSMISTKILSIQEAIKNKDTFFILDDKKIELNPNVGIFVTLNPAGQGYGGRNKLPDNLKQLFRPIVMSKPDQSLIINVSLHAEGFKYPDILAIKLVETFESAMQLLSNQQHYDWGLRAIKTVIGFCGTLLKATTTQKTLSDECSIIVQALELNTISKLTYNDSVLFKSLISQIFPEIKKLNKAQIHESLIQKIQKSAEFFGLQANQKQEQKCIELYEQLQQRMGVVIMGPPSTGKTTIIQLLAQALGNVKMHKINPKAQSKIELLGKVDLDTRQWIDGIISKAAQQAYSENSDVMSWIIFDGDVDPEWIESLNSVLDDNRLLTLPSGWRIQFGSNVNFLFETNSLQHASPATISRMGIIFLSNEDINIQHIVDSWIKISPNSMILKEYEQYFNNALKWLEKNGQYICNCSIVSTMKNFFYILSDVKTKSHLAMCLINGLGANMTLLTKEKFTKMVLEMTEEYVPETDLHYYFYNKERDNIDSYQFIEPCSYNTGDLIKTPRISQAIDILINWIKYSKSVFVIGPSGSGKRQLISKCAEMIRATECITIHCNAYTSPNQLILKIAQVSIVVTNNKGRFYRPKNSERLILHFKNLNHVKPDKWGTIKLGAFIQQLIFFGGFYEPSTLEWVGIDDNFTIINSLTSTDEIDSRLMSASNILYLEPPQLQELVNICSEYLSSTIPDKSTVSSVIVDLMLKTRDILTTVKMPHYTFNNHIINSFCYNLNRYQITDSKNMAQVLYLEANHIFSNKLVKLEDKKLFNDIINQIYLKYCLEYKNEDFIYVCESNINSKNVDLLSKMPIGDWKQIVKKQLLLNEQTAQDVEINLELIHRIVADCERSLSKPGKCLFLVGRLGVGRNLAVRLISLRRNATIVTPNIRQVFNLKTFSNDIKSVLQKCGIDDEVVYYVVEEFYMTRDEVMDTVSCMIVSGEVLGLYQNEELETLCTPLKDQMAQENYEGTHTNFFIERIKKNLHVILILDSRSDFFKTFLENSPAIIDLSDIIWLDQWTTTVMKIIPEIIFKKNNLDQDFPQINNYISHFPQIHYDAEDWMNTCPKRYLLFIQTFSTLLLSKKEYIKRRLSHLKAGISKLVNARDIVAKLKSDADHHESELAKKREKANQALMMISSTMQGANTKKEQMENLKKEFQIKNDALNQRKKEIDTELAQVEPLIEEAQAAVSNIKPESLTEIRSLRAPAEIIRDILEGVLRLMGIQDTSWNSMKSFLAKRGVKEDIRFFDARRITEDNRYSVEKLLELKRDSFDAKNAKRASAAAAPLASWVVANVAYSRILHKIKPLEIEHMSLKTKLQNAEEQIRLLSGGVDSVEKNVLELREQLNINTKQATEIELNIHKEKLIIDSAQNLVKKLDGEFSRWGQQITELTSTLDSLLLNNLLASAFITYLSECSDYVRNEKLEKWKFELKVDKFLFSKFMESERQILQWITEGLPSDETSYQNAIILKQEKFYPLILDPNGNILQWLKKKLPPNSTEYTSFETPQFHSKLELAIRFGKKIVIQNVNNLDPILVPILKNDFIIEGNRTTIQIADKLVDFNDNFQLYLFSNNEHLNLPSHYSVLLTVINFTQNQISLSEQLLRYALQVENPKLDSKHLELLRIEEELKTKLYDLQENVLKDLADSQDNILENKDLLNSLDSIKSNSDEISKSLNESIKMQNILETECQVYKPLANYTSRLYFALKDLFIINRFSQISLTVFVKLFQSSLKGSIGNLNRETKILHDVYYHISRSLFVDQRLIFALHLAHKLYPEEFGLNEWELFIGKSISNVNKELNFKDNIPKWIDEDRIFDVYCFKECIPELYKNLQLENINIWSEYIKTSNTKIPSSIKLTNFQQVLVVQALKPDKLYKTLTDFVLKQLKLSDLSPTLLKMSELAKEKVGSIMIITSVGSDPSDELRLLAKQQTNNNCIEITMGANQVEIEQLEKHCKQPKWLILKNLHLCSTSTLVSLEEHLKSLNTTNKEFILWITTEMTDKIQTSLILSCIKVAYETPRGLKKNIRRAYSVCQSDNIKCNTIDESRSIYALAWFHSILLERRTYIPQGWSQYYEFNDSDLLAALRVIRQYTAKDNNTIKWPYIHGLYEKAIYGGRITNTQDIEILKTYLKIIFGVNSSNWNNSILGIQELNSTDNQAIEKALKNIPDQDLPSLLNMPDNVDKSWQKKESDKVILQLRGIGVVNINYNYLEGDWRSEIITILNLWKTLNKDINLIDLLTSKTYFDQNDTPEVMDAFINQELHFAVGLIKIIHKNLAAVNKTIKSNMRPSGSVSDTIFYILRLKTPKSWINYWNGPEDPGSYMRHVITRTISLHKLQFSLDKTPQQINLNNLFHPRTFLVAFKQLTSKLYGTSMDSLILDCSLSTNKLKSSKKTVTITNVLIEGARLHQTSLLDNTIDSPSVSNVDEINIAWIPKDTIRSTKNSDLYVILYETQSKDNIICLLPVSISQKEHEKWTLTGITLFLRC